MSSWESVTLTPDDVESFREPTFGRVWRGYDPDEVSAYVKRLTGRIQVLEHNVADFESELEQARKRIGSGADSSGREEAFETIAERLAGVLQAFDEDMLRIRNEAQGEADLIVEAAMADADRIRVDAQANAEEVRAEAERAAKEAREQADELLSGLETRRSSMLMEIRALRDRMLESARAIVPPAGVDQQADEVVIANDEVAVSEGTGGSRENFSPGA